jgi:adenosine deaminase
VTVNAIKSAFIHFDDRIRLIYDVIKPGYAKARGEQGGS